MILKTLHRQFISKLKTALREARDCFVNLPGTREFLEGYLVLMRRTVELNYMPFARHRAGISYRPVPTGNVLPNLRVYQYTKNNNPLQEGVIEGDAYWHVVPQLIPYIQYKAVQNIVKSADITIPPNETREVVDVTTAENNGEFPGTFTIRAEKDARVTYVLAVFGDAEVTKDVTLELHEGAEGRIVSVIIARGKARFTLKTTLRHSAPRTKGDIKIKMVLKDTAYVSYDGLIKIDKPAQQTNSYLDARTLILNRGAKCDGKPELEIEADDVKASHAFSSGKIDSEQLFYLRSRGLTEKEAKQMIVEGFLMDVAQKLSHEAQERIKREVAIAL